jgi:aspartyl-tRNA(Asn)/glutamyl-tRNA(Gln) amidotransferase subunit A
MLENYLPPFDATVVERILDAGSIMIGKTNMDEFGMGSVSSSHFGTVKNPWNLLTNKNDSNEQNDFFISGGSSGGSAASVAAGIASLFEF